MVTRSSVGQPTGAGAYPGVKMVDKNSTVAGSSDPLPIGREDLLNEVRYLNDLAQFVAQQQHVLLDKVSAITLRLQLLHAKLEGTNRNGTPQ